MEYEVSIVTFVGCTPDVGSKVVDRSVGENNVGSNVGSNDGVTIVALVCAIVGEIVGCMVGVIVGCTVLIDGLVVGRVLGATVFGAIVGKAIGIGVVGITSIVLIISSIARLVKLHIRFIYIDSSSSNVSSPPLLPTDTTERWALSPTQHVLLSEIVSMNS